MKRISLATAVFLLAAGFAAAARAAQGDTDLYFDAHNHFTGILPYYAYANLPRFIESLSDPSKPVGPADRLALFHYLTANWYPKYGAALDDRLFSPPDGQRFALGARAALIVYRSRVAKDPKEVDGVLERVLTATPWSEFDSAYAFRGGPADEYLRARFYGGSIDLLGHDLCKATVLDLAATNVQASEQSLPFLGGWHIGSARWGPLNTIDCVMKASTDSAILHALARMRKPMPAIRFVLMTHTSQLATLPGGKTYSEWSKTGQCAAVPLPKDLVTTPETIYHALLGQDDSGKVLLSLEHLRDYFSTVAGIDTAGPETTCFSATGMEYYEGLADAVYRAAKARRALGWHGKLLVHTHVGENSTVYYSPTPPSEPWTFSNTFAQLPAVRSDAKQAHENISMLLAAVTHLESTHPDLNDYVVFRFAHVTWADEAQAQSMHDQRIEADVNLESNVATGAYPMSRMPLGPEMLKRYWIDPTIANPVTNLRLNDLLALLVTNTGNVRQVGGILGNASLRYLLERRVVCLLGTDADGVEHSDIIKEHQYAGSLIDYWNRTDSQFAATSNGISNRTFFDNTRWHLTNMTTDTALPR